jgi:chitinase
MFRRLIFGIANSRYDLAIKQALSATGSTGFTYPACSAVAYVSGQAYTAGETVSYGGYIWEVCNLNPREGTIH